MRKTDIQSTDSEEVNVSSLDKGKLKENEIQMTISL